jgi:hypothetical protein
MIVRGCTGTCYVPFGCGSASLGSYGLVHGMCNYVNNTKYRAAIGRIS